MNQGLSHHHLGQPLSLKGRESDIYLEFDHFHPTWQKGGCRVGLLLIHNRFKIEDKHGVALLEFKPQFFRDPD